MNFDLSEEQELLQQMVEQLVSNECPPKRIREIYDEDSAHLPDLWKKLSELGIAGIAIPEPFGGAGLELLDLAVVAETLGYCAVPGPFFSHSIASLAIAHAGSDAQKEAWLPKLASGEAIATFAFAEGDGRWHPEEWRTKGGETLTGEKHFVPFADESDVIVVGIEGGGLTLVARTASGLSCEAFADVDRTRRVNKVDFVNTPCEALPDGAEVSGRIRDAALVLLASDAFGGATRLVETCVEYAKTREQFGVTIGHFQALKHQLANMAVEVEPTRGLYWYAAHAIDHALEDAERSAAIAKAHISDRFMQVARDSVEAHGGIGFTWECDVQIWFKRALFDRAFLGTPATHRERAGVLAGW